MILAEVIDDTELITIALTPPDPCIGVTCPNKCTGYNLYSQKCVNGVCVNDTLIEANAPTCGYVPPALPAKGDVVSLDYPTSAINGESITISARVKNIGESPGNFYLCLYSGASELRRISAGAIAPEFTSTSKSMTTTVPSSGTSVNYTVKCIRIV